MEVTLRELLTSDILQSVLLEAGAAGLEHRVVAVCVIDSPGGYDYIKPDELVVSSGYFLSLERSSEQIELIDKLFERGAAGILLKTQYFSEGKLPAALLDRANERGFPLITYPEQMRNFRDLITFFDTSLYCRGTREFIYKEDLLALFIRSIKAKGLAGLAKQLHQLLGLNVAILFEQCSFVYPAASIETSFNQTITDCASQQPWKPSEKYPDLIELSGGAGSDQALFGISIEFGSSGANGSIWVDCQERNLDQNDRILLKNAQLACNIEIKSITESLRKHEEHRIKFIEQLLSGQAYPWSDTTLALVANRLHLPLKTQVLLIYCLDDEELHFDLESAARDFFKAKQETPSIYSYQENVVILLPPAYVDTPRVVSELQTALAKEFEQHHLVLGLGHATHLKNIGLSYGQAQYAVRTGELVDAIQPIRDFKKLGFYRLGCPSAMPDELVRFCQDYIGALAELDRTTNLDLLNTLHVFFECQENYSKAGKALFLEPNAIRYRIKVVEKACRADFNREFDLLNIKIALYYLPITNLTQKEGRNASE